MEEIIKQVIIAYHDLLRISFFEKGEIIHYSNNTSNNIYIVKSGVLRSYYYQNGNEITAHFATEHTIIGAVDSMLKQKKSIYFIEALENSEVLIMDYHEMENFLTKNPAYERLARQVSQLLYLELVERFEGMMFLTAKERYDHLVARYPTINQQVSLKHIASYLGITQETLSRVRKLK